MPEFVKDFLRGDPLPDGEVFCYERDLFDVLRQGRGIPGAAALVLVGDAAPR